MDWAEGIRQVARPCDAESDEGIFFWLLLSDRFTFERAAGIGVGMTKRGRGAEELRRKVVCVKFSKKDIR